MPITVEGHHDFAVLEARLAALIDETRAADPAGPLAPVAVIAPTRRLLDHLKTRLAARFPALLHVHALHHDALARAAAAAAGAPAPRVLSDHVLDALTARLVADAGGALADYAAARPGAAAALRRTFDDLREAGIEPGEALRVGGLSGGARDVLRLYAGYHDALARLAPAGVSDRAGVPMAALPHAAAFARRFRLIVHYGAYDIVGLNLRMLRALAGAGPRVVCLVPHHPSAPAFVHSARFWTEATGAPPAAVPAGEPLAAAAGSGASAARLLGDRLPWLHDETVAGRPPAGGAIRHFHARGAADELREVALRILAGQRGGGPPLHDIAVIARSLAPYAADLGPVFDEHRLPFSTHASAGALREARVRAALRLARVALFDYERQPLMDLLRSGLVRLRGRDPSAEAHAWDRAARRWRVAGGHAVWTGDLPEWQAAWAPSLPADAGEEARARAEETRGRRLRQARSLAAAVVTLARVLRPLSRAAGWVAFADAMTAACATLLDGFAGGDEIDPGAAAVREALAALRDCATAGLPFDRAAALPAFERALAGIAVPIVPDGGPAAGGGVQVLDAMQARGLSFDTVYLIGWNADLIPRRPREDPFLRDADRLLLRAALSTPLPIGAHAVSEERLLLAHLLGTPRRSLTVSWQRADARGRAKVASLALREAARLVRGSPDAGALAGAAERVAGHPGAAAIEARAAHGLLPPVQARLGAALQAGSPARLLAALDRLPSLAAGDGAIVAAGLDLLRTIDAFTPEDLRFDACAGLDAGSPAPWSPSRLERFGVCPQRYFFRHLLRVAELEEPLPGYEPDPADLGLRVHDVLRDLYAGLAGPAAPRAEAAGRALASLPEVFARHTADLHDRLAGEVPIFWESLRERWLAALAAFVRSDLDALAAAGAAVLWVEKQAAAAIDPGDGRPLPLAGRFDRVARAPDGALVVADYKTAGNLEDRARPAAALKGTSLQLPLYVLIAEGDPGVRGSGGGRVAAEYLGVGPSFAAAEGAGGAAEGAAGARPSRVPLDPRLLEEHRGGFLETLGVLRDLAADGRYPLHDGRWCEWCPYRRACRRLHPPTVARLRAAAPLRDYYALEGKSTRRPRLHGAGEEEDA